MKVTEPSKAIYCLPNYGPIFGDGREICIPNNSNKTKTFISCLGKSYASELYLYQTEKANSLFGGSKEFSIEEMEVYQQIL